MEDSTNEGLRRDAIGDHVADLVEHRLRRRNLEGQPGTRGEPTPAPFEVCRVDHPLGVVLALGGELDLATVAVLQEELERAIPGRGAVVIDLSGLRFIDSSGLDVLMQAERELYAWGGRLVLVRETPAVRRIFELTGLDRYFAWCDSPSAALRTARERRGRSPRIPQPAADRQTPAEPEGELGGAMRS